MCTVLAAADDDNTSWENKERGRTGKLPSQTRNGRRARKKKNPPTKSGNEWE